MKISQDQLREAAQILFPQQWKTDRAAALLGALKIFEEASFDVETRPASKAKKNDHKKPAEIVALEEHLKNNQIHVTAVAKAIGVNPVTFYSWLHGTAEPKASNLAKIRNFLTKTKA